MPTANGAFAHFDDTTPPAPTGQRNAKWQTDAPYSGSLIWNGITYTVLFFDLSAYVPNFGGEDARTTATETIGLSSMGKVVTLTDASPIAVTLDSTVPSYFVCFFANIGSTTATFTPSSGQIRTPTSALAASLAVLAGQWGMLAFDGTNWTATVASLTSSTNFSDAETPSGTINGSNTAFTLAHTPSPAASLILTIDGQVLAPAGVDYTLSGAGITMASAPSTGTVMRAWYRY